MAKKKTKPAVRKTGRTKVKSAKALHAKRFPGESAKYRTARNALLKAEMQLRAEGERVAAQRRKLPLGGVVREDYVFDAPGGGRVRLSELFAGGKNSLIVYNFMFGPAMKAACPACTSILDSVDGASPHVTQRANLVIVARSPIDRIMEHARARGWRNLRLLSSSGNTYNRDYFGETESGEQWPMLNVFVKRGGRIHHTYATELFFAPKDKGMDPRHVDAIWPVWNLFDYVPEGRGTNWYPRLSYDAE
jgi:predicted dithiol-disulfide oxidoreductase (DUF899 family)